MKKGLPFFLVALILPIFLISCVDVVQTIDFVNGKYEIGQRITANKGIFAMSGSPIPEFSEQSISESFGSFDSLGNTDNFEYYQIESATDVGIGFRTSFTEDDHEKTNLIPQKIDTNKTMIPLFGSQEFSERFMDGLSSNSDTESGVFARAMLSSAKWSVFVTKNVIPSMKKAYIENNFGQINVECLEIGDVYNIRIPIVLIENGVRLVVEN